MPTFSFDIQTDQLQISYFQVERRSSPGGSWAPIGDPIPARPGTVHHFADTDFSVEDLPLDYRVIPHTSDDTPGTPSVTLTNTGT